MTNGLRDESDSAHRYAVSLLARLGLAEGHLKRREPGLHPAIGWARSGAMALTGRRDGPARLCLIPLAACAEGTLQAFEAIGERPFLSPLFGSALLTERAAIAGLTRNGTISPGGSCRLLQARDGWIAANLSPIFLICAAEARSAASPAASTSMPVRSSMTLSTSGPKSPPR